MLSALKQTRHNLEAEIAPILGAELAAAVAEAFVGAVAGHGREIDAMAGTKAKRERRDHLASTAQAARIGLSALGSGA